MLNFLAPPFIKKLDKYFLLNHPVLWISKIHYVLYYAVIMWLLSALLGYVLPVNLSQTQDIALWYVLFSILAIILFCIWIYRNAIFNVEKKFGNRHWTDEYKLFLLYFACVFIFFSFAYPFAIAYNSKIAHTVSDEEFIADINTLNRAEPFIPEELYNYYTYYDSIKNKTFYDINRCQSFGRYTPFNTPQDRSLDHALKSGDQLKADYLYDKTSDQRILKALADRDRVMKKYGLNEHMTPEELLKTYKVLCARWQVSGETTLSYTGDDYSINRIFSTLSEAKFATLFLFRPDFLLFIFYFIFYIVIFFLLFRNNQWQHFLIAIITLIVLPILLFIIGQILPYSLRLGSRDFIFDTGTLIVFTLGLFFAARFMVLGKKFSAFNNICMQLMYVLFPVIGMFVLYYLKRHTGIFHDMYNYDYSYESALENLDTTSPDTTSAAFFFNKALGEYWRKQYDLWFIGMQISGAVVFILLVMPLMKEIFVKQLALPRRK